MLYLFNYCIAFSTLITAATLFTMDKPSQKIRYTSFQKITAVPNPKLIVALKGKNAAIANFDGCNIVDLENNNVTTTIKSPNTQSLIVNKKKTLLGIDTSDYCSLYSIKNGTLLWQTPINVSYPSTFTADGTLWSFDQKNGSFISSRGNTCTSYPKQLSKNMCGHPTEAKIFCSREIYKKYNKTYEKSLYIVPIDEKRRCKVKKIILEKVILEEERSANKLGNETLIKGHSSTGNIVALYSPKDAGWSLYDYEKKEIILDLLGYNNLAFHPTKSIVALLTQRGELSLYNFKTGKILDSITLKSKPHLSTTSIDFSHNGKALIFIIGNECYRFNTCS